MKKPFHDGVWIGAVLLGMTVIGCEGSDNRAVEVAQQATQQQAHQNQMMAEQSQRTTQAASELVRAEAAARQELTQVQRQLVERDAQARRELNRLQQDVEATGLEPVTFGSVDGRRVFLNHHGPKNLGPES